MQGRPITIFQQEEAIAAAALTPGNVVQLPDGRAAIVGGVKSIASGEKYPAITRADCELACASGTTLSAGADVQWDVATSLVVASGGAGDFRVGVVKTAKTSGQTVVRVALNEAELVMP